MENREEGTDEEGYRLVLPTRAHPLDRFVTSRCTLELTPRQILIIEQIGPIRKRMRHDWGSNSTFSLQSKYDTQGTSMPETYGIRVNTAGSKLWLALGYPREKLNEVLGQLTRIQDEWRESMRTPAPWGDAAESKPTGPETFPSEEDGTLSAEQAEQINSAEQALAPSAAAGASIEIQIRPTSDGIHITVPASGLHKGTHGLWAPFAFFAALVGAIMFGTLVGVIPHEGDLMGSIPVVLMFGALFGALGLAMLNMARRSAVLEVDNTSVHVQRKSLFNDGVFEFPRTDITDVRRGNSTLQINGKFVQELQIMVKGHMKVRMMSQRTPEEIQLVAEAMMASLSKPGDESVA